MPVTTDEHGSGNKESTVPRKETVLGRLRLGCDEKSASENATSTSENQANPGAAKSGATPEAVGDPHADLVAVVVAWPTLSKAARTAIVSLIRQR
jgi:hypothetical protein